MNKHLKKFFDNELSGIKAILKSWSRPLASFHDSLSQMDNKEIITEETQPYVYKVIKEISDAAKVYPKEVSLKGSEHDTSGSSTWGHKIEIGRGIAKHRQNLEFTYAHELGHEKYFALHKTISIAIDAPKKLLFSATTCLYTAGALAYPLTDKVMHAANYTFEHTGKFLLAGIAINAITKRFKEYTADLFAYKYTGHLPKKMLEIDEEKRKGIIGNTSKIIGEIISYAESGYPLNIERDLVCKIFGKKQKPASFTAQINEERQGKQELSNNSQTL